MFCFAFLKVNRIYIDEKGYELTLNDNLSHSVSKMDPLVRFMKFQVIHNIYALNYTFRSRDNKGG